MVMSRMRPPEVLIYAAGGGAGSRLVMSASSRVPISPRCSLSRSALKDGSNRRLKPIITRGLLPAISLQHARARSVQVDGLLTQHRLAGPDRGRDQRHVA